MRAYDRAMMAFVAIKIVKNKQSFHRQAQIELALLRNLNLCDPLGDHKTGFLLSLTHLKRIRFHDDFPDVMSDLFSSIPASL